MARCAPRARTVRLIVSAAAFPAALLGASACASAPAAAGPTRDTLYFSADADSADVMFFAFDGRVFVHDSAVVVEVTSGQLGDVASIGTLSAAFARIDQRGDWVLDERSNRKGPGEYVKAGQVVWAPLRFVVPTGRVVRQMESARLVFVLERQATSSPSVGAAPPVTPPRWNDRRVVPLELRRTASTHTAPPQR